MKITCVFKNKAGDLLTIPHFVSEANGGKMVSTKNINIPSKEVYIAKAAISMSDACKIMIAPWATTLPAQILRRLASRTTALLNAINNNTFLDIWHSCKKDSSGLKAQILITSKLITLELNNQKSLIIENKPRVLNLAAINSLTMDVLKNLAKNTHQEIAVARETISRIQLGR